MRPTRHLRFALLLAALSLAPACGDDSGANGDGGDPFDGGTGIPDSELTAPPDGAGVTVGDDGRYYCDTGVGQQILCACNDGQDNDADGMTDTADPGCAAGWDNNEDVAFTPGGTQCTDLVDNEDTPDGLIDSQDPECTGALDDDESSFATGIPGDNMDECHQDCWFDGDSGAGNDGCDWRLGCDPVAGAYYDCNMPGANVCNRMQTDECFNFCRPLTPNGCDCFGCCDIVVDGTSYTILLTAECSVDEIRTNGVAPANPDSSCVSCTKVASCDNPCDPCEYCLGHVPEPGCTSTTTPDGGVSLPDAPGCPEGQTPCDPTDPDGGYCQPDEFCLTGCCVSVID